MRSSRSRRVAMPKGRRHQRGAALAMTGIAMVMIAAMAVIGVDVGHVAFTANEVQALADLSATSYATTLAANLDDGTARDPVAETESVVTLNSVGSAPATMDNIASLDPGNYDPATRQFQAGGTPVNAVRATAVATVPNFFAGIFGDPESTVTRQAIAALTPPGKAPVLPLAIGECFWDIFQNTGDCALLPHFTLVPETIDNSCWTGLLDGSASASTIAGIIRVYCGLASGTPSRVGVGDDITLINGKLTPVLRAVQDCLDAGVNEFTVPVIPCNQCNQTGEVLSFATITVSGVVSTGAAASTGIYADSVCSVDPPGATGGGTVSTGLTIVTLVG